MKIKCNKCGKIVDENKVIKQGWVYFCSDKCCKKYNQSFLWAGGIILGLVILYFLFMIIVLFN